MTYEITEHNATTGEIMTREMTAEEIAIYQEQVRIRQEFLAKQEAENAKAEAKRAAALAKLEAIGLSEEDLKALGF